MGRLHKNIQLMLELLKAPFLVLHFSYYALMTFLMMLSVILLSDNNTLYFKCDQVSDLWQQLELASEIESDLQTLWTGSRSGLLISVLGKLLDRSNNTGSIDVKVDGSVLEEISSFQMLDLTFSSKLDWGSSFDLYSKWL